MSFNHIYPSPGSSQIHAPLPTHPAFVSSFSSHTHPSDPVCAAHVWLSTGFGRPTKGNILLFFMILIV